MGCIYNIPPIRSKDVPYIDVLSESINNPLRMLAGWFIASTASVAPAPDPSRAAHLTLQWDRTLTTYVEHLYL
jgi:hypothetical protein